uniref:G-patch domain-containing protein n=2 Tax=Cajanus cajan TaxID=3821 RepID=A0A151RVQ7_CAJCA|nr:hypothetical protein KK1_031729 [Cajanus cajan]
MDHILARVLVDNGSSLNVMPKATLAKLPYDGSYIKPSTMIVRVFDGSRREVINEISLPIQIGPLTFEVVFHVMDIAPAYSCLLGRPWIHCARVVPSTLHQKLKFIVDDTLIIVLAEEDLLVSKPSSTPYIEVAKEALETSFQGLEIANVSYGKNIVKPQPSGASMMVAKTMLGSGYQHGCGLGRDAQGPSQFPELIDNKDRFVLGFKPSKAYKWRVVYEKRERRLAMLENREAKIDGVPICDLRESFWSVGFEFPNSIALVEQDFHEEEQASLVRACPLNMELNNWEIVEVPVVFNSDLKFEKNALESDNASVASNNFDCPINQTYEEIEHDLEPSPKLLRLVEQEVKEIQPHEELTETINLGDKEEKKEVKIGMLMKEPEHNKLIRLLHDYKGVFAWSYQDMPGLDTSIVEHKLPLKPECPPVKQKLR